jgi:hypothetical protein
MKSQEKNKIFVDISYSNKKMGKRKTNTHGLFEIQKINQKHLSSVAFQIIENIQQHDGHN